MGCYSTTHQTNKITNWLSQWELDDRATAQNETGSTASVYRARANSIDSEASAPRPSFQQTDISNWLKSWGHNNSTSESEKIHNTSMTPMSSQETLTTAYSELK